MLRDAITCYYCYASISYCDGGDNNNNNNNNNNNIIIIINNNNNNNCNKKDLIGGLKIKLGIPLSVGIMQETTLLGTAKILRKVLEM